MTEKYPSQILQDAVEAISSLPGVGSRSALRLALHLLSQPKENVHHFATAVNRLADDVKYCRECMMISDDDICTICGDRKRDHRTICVVESVRDVMSIEATGQYRGVYHVLGGIISPIAGVGPSDLRIRELVDRIALLSSGEGVPSDDVSSRPLPKGPLPLMMPRVAQSSEGTPSPEDNTPVEVIMALSGDVEGETTAFYIFRQIEKYGVKVTTLARGLAFGDDLEYADSLTLGRSIINRTVFKP